MVNPDPKTTKAVTSILKDGGHTHLARYIDGMQLELDLIESLCNQTIDELNIQQGDFGIEYSTASPTKSVASVILWLTNKINHGIETCAQIAESNLIDMPYNAHDNGKNAACRIIAFQIRKQIKP